MILYLTGKYLIFVAFLLVGDWFLLSKIFLDFTVGKLVFALPLCLYNSLMTWVFIIDIPPSEED